MAKAKKLVRKLPPPKKSKLVVSVRKPPAVAPEAVPAKPAPELRTTREGVILSKVVVSPEGVILKVED